MAVARRDIGTRGWVSPSRVIASRLSAAWRGRSQVKSSAPYPAGLFRDSLLDDLLRVTFGFEGGHDCRSGEPPHGRGLASKHTLSNYLDGSVVYHDDEVSTEKPSKLIRFASIDHHCQCVAASDGFGQVTSASLRITSQLLPAVLVLKPGLDGLQRPEYHIGIGDGDGVVNPSYMAGLRPKPGWSMPSPSWDEGVLSENDPWTRRWDR